MKITRRQLRRIIKEEKARILRENSGNIDAYFDSPPPGAEPRRAGGPRPATREEMFEMYVKKVEEVVEFHGQEFSDEGIKAAMAEVLKRLGIQATIT